MKKLLVLMIIFGMASVASAAISLSLDGSTAAPATADISAATTIYIISDDTAAYRTYWDMLKAKGTLSTPVDHANAGNIAGVVDYSTVSLYDYECTAASNLSPTDIVAGIHFTATLTPTGSVSDTFLVEILEGDSPYAQIDGITFTIVPEPAMIALLSLGGLFLRRRK